MILHKLNLANFRAYDQIELEFEPGVNVIAGVNGVGKSSLLRAMATGFSRVMPMVTPSTVPPLSLTDEDVTLGKSAATISLSLWFDEHEVSAQVQRLLENRPERKRLAEELEKMRGDKRRVAEPTKHLQRLEQLKLKRSLQGLRGALSESGDQFTFQIKGLVLPKDSVIDELTVKQAANEAIKSLCERPNQPVAIFYSPRRSLAGRPRKLPTLTPLSIPSAYPHALEDADVELRDFMMWFRYHELSDNKRAHAVIGQLAEVVTRFVKDFGKLRIEEEPFLRFVVEKNGKPFGLHQLSDGERGLLAMLFDITRRLAIANPESSDPIGQGQAVVLIDEIELHLHPSWQRKVLRRLTQTFKSCQFIVTTHSPQIIGQVKPASLRLLYLTEEGKVDRAPVAQSFGMDSNWVLQEIMGTPPRDYETEQKLSAIHDAIDAGHLKKARGLVKALEKSLGLFPDLQEMKSMLDRFEMLKRG